MLYFRGTLRLYQTLLPTNKNVVFAPATMNVVVALKDKIVVFGVLNPLPPGHYTALLYQVVGLKSYFSTS